MWLLVLYTNRLTQTQRDLLHFIRITVSTTVIVFAFGTQFERAKVLKLIALCRVHDGCILLCKAEQGHVEMGSEANH